MSQLSADVAGHAKPHAIELDGVRYEFRHLGAAQLAEYQRKRFERERDKLRLLRDDYPPAVYVERLDLLRERFDRGEFDLLAEIEEAGLRDGDLDALSPAQRARVPGVILTVLAIMTGRSDEENWRLFMKLPQEAGQILSLVLSESYGHPTQAAGKTGTPAAGN